MKTVLFMAKGGMSPDKNAFFNHRFWTLLWDKKTKLFKYGACFHCLEGWKGKAEIARILALRIADGYFTLQKHRCSVIIYS